jgi:hypothetical protein
MVIKIKLRLKMQLSQIKKLALGLQLGSVQQLEFDLKSGSTFISKLLVFVLLVHGL